MFLATRLFRLINSFLFIIYSLFTPAPSTADPITFREPESVKMSFVAYADPQIMPSGYHQVYHENSFEDIVNSGIDFDAFVIAGDLTENTDAPSYDIYWEIMDKSPIKNIVIASGNHDLRFNYENNLEMIMGKVEEYIGVSTDKPYYSYTVNGYTFIVLGTEKARMDDAYISDEQLSFLDNQLAMATQGGKPAFVVCHQPLTHTHGTPTTAVGNGDLGEQSAQVREILERYTNVFFLTGHLHDGVSEKSLEVLNEENGVYSLNLPAFGRANEVGEFRQMGLGTYAEVYEGEIIFTVRDFVKGYNLEGCTMTFTLK
ncbi:MAG: metallophosphoesterase [Clostridia bacterium]|nr:metallophosphoesterase [Clostridia bacterium]